VTEEKNANQTVPSTVVAGADEEYVPLALRDMAEMSPKELERAQAEEAQRAMERGYTVTTWNGLPRYKATFSAFDSMDEGQIREYVANHRNGLGIYGDSATAPRQGALVRDVRAKKKGGQ
jgi:muconolactone delta-isomerase